MARFARALRACRIALFGVPHQHQWETIERIKIHDSDNKLYVKDQFILRCKHCGDMKSRKF